jgi:hypothetical protein
LCSAAFTADVIDDDEHFVGVIIIMIMTILGINTNNDDRDLWIVTATTATMMPMTILPLPTHLGRSVGLGSPQHHRHLQLHSLKLAAGVARADNDRRRRWGERAGRRDSILRQVPWGKGEPNPSSGLESSEVVHRERL